MTRTLEAELKLKAVDLTGKALTSVSRKLGEVERKAAAVTRAQGTMGRVAAANMRAVDEAGAALLRFAAPAALVYGGARSLKHFAEVDRQMTRIGITADASALAMRRSGKELRAVAFDAAMPIDQVRQGLDGLVASGRDLSESMALLPAVTRTAQASGAAVADIATTATSVSDAFQIAGESMEGAFDIMAKGGKLGKFELRDMAQYLPSLAPAFTVVGEKGEAGLAKLVAMLQVVRMQTGTASEAATGMANVLQKMETDETAKKFSKFGIDLRKEMRNARRDGKDLIEVFLDLSEKALKGDLSKIPQLFTDAQFGLGMRALLMNRKEIGRFADALKDSAGTVAGDLARVTGDAQAKLDRLAGAFEHAASSAGAFLDSVGVTDSLSAFAAGITDISEALDDLAQRGGGVLGGKESGGLLGWLNQKTGGALNAITSEGGRVAGAGTGEPGDIYSSWVEQWVDQAKDASKDVMFGRRPAPVPEARPKRRNDGALGEYFGDGTPRDPGTYGPPRTPFPHRRPVPAATVAPALVADAAAREAAVDPAAMDLLLSSRTGSGIVNSGRRREDDLADLNAAVGIPRRLGDEAPAPYARPADRTLYAPGGFQPSGPGGAPVGEFIADRAVAGLGDLPAAAGRVVATFDGLAQEAGRFRAALDTAPPDWPQRPSGPAIQFRPEGLEFPSQRRARLAAEAERKRRTLGPVDGDVTLGSAGAFQETGRAAQRFLDDIDTDEVVDKLKALPSAMDAGAFAAAAQAASDAFVSTLTAGLSRAEAVARDAAARMQASLSFAATPTVTPRINAPRPVVNADLGRSMPDIGAP